VELKRFIEFSTLDSARVVRRAKLEVSRDTDGQEWVEEHRPDFARDILVQARA